jgi:poly-gamma-glutamate synthesis protein (capsule biosynthesis protein)
MKRTLLCALLLLAGCRSPDSLAKRPAPEVFELPPVHLTAPARGAPAPPVTITVLVGGDVLPHRPMLDEAGVEMALAPLSPLFKSADRTLVNYEAATGDPARAPRMTYVAKPDWMGALSRSGILAITGANNHACDAGLPGLKRTLEAAQEASIGVYGIDEADPWRPHTLVEKEGRRVCVVAWTTLVNTTSACSKSYALATAPLDRTGLGRVATAIGRAAREKCDATIAVFHGGDEYMRQNAAVLAMARQAADSGAHAVVIHHPHVVSPVLEHETKDGRKVPIFSSVGNLVSNQGESYRPSMPPSSAARRRLVCVNGWTRLGMLARVAMRFDDDKDRPALTWGYHLLWGENEHVDRREKARPKIRVRLLDRERDREIVGRFSADMTGAPEVFEDPRWL